MIAPLLAGIAVFVGAGLTYKQFRQQRTRREQFQRQQIEAQNLLISNQVAKGFELLGNKDKEITQRLGGIYALEGVIHTSENYRRPVLQVLCAFVRNETKAKTGDDPLASDVQAVLTVIGRHTSGQRRPDPDLSEAHIPKPNLGGAALRGARVWSSKLGGANLGAREDPNACYMFADLSGANLSAADLRYAGLAVANLIDINLTRADLTRANLSGADLTRADLSGANLTDANPTDAHLSGADLSGADFSGADLSGAKKLTQVQLDQACGDEKTKLDPPLTIKPCPPDWTAAGGSK